MRARRIVSRSEMERRYAEGLYRAEVELVIHRACITARRNEGCRGRGEAREGKVFTETIDNNTHLVSGPS